MVTQIMNDVVAHGSALAWKEESPQIEQRVSNRPRRQVNQEKWAVLLDTKRKRE